MFVWLRGLCDVQMERLGVMFYRDEGGLEFGLQGLNRWVCFGRCAESIFRE
jgi:hypothetical protein